MTGTLQPHDFSWTSWK